jgi:hypothetical protein
MVACAPGLLCKERLSRMTTSPGRSDAANIGSSQASKITRFMGSGIAKAARRPSDRKPCDHRLALPVAEGRLGDEPVTFWAATTGPCHLDGCAGLTNKHKAVLRLRHEGLAALDPHRPRPWRHQACLVRRPGVFFFKAEAEGDESATAWKGPHPPPLLVLEPPPAPAW